MGEKKVKSTDAPATPGRSPVWETGTTPNKTEMKRFAKEFTEAEGRKTKASLARFAVENNLSAEALAELVSTCLGPDKAIEPEVAAALRRSALRTLNGGAKVKRTKSGDDGEQANPEAKAKSKAKAKAKAKPKAKAKAKSKSEDDESGE